MQSPRGKLLQQDWKKLGVGLLIALGGALATYLLETIPTLDFGTWTPVVVAINSFLVNVLRKWIGQAVY